MDARGTYILAEGVSASAVYLCSEFKTIGQGPHATTLLPTAFWDSQLASDVLCGETGDLRKPR